jgi:hypothetical protein
MPTDFSKSDRLRGGSIFGFRVWVADKAPLAIYFQKSFHSDIHPAFFCEFRNFEIIAVNSGSTIPDAPLNNRTGEIAY